MGDVSEADATKSVQSDGANETTLTKDVEIKPIAQSGFARLKPEYIIKKEEKIEVAASKDEAVSMDKNAGEQSSELRPKRNRGMNRGRDQAMAKARHEVQERVVRLCRSIAQPGVACKFGEKCNALHSAREYWEKRLPDIGDICTIYEQYGTCNFGLACRYANAHTNPETLEQLKKESNPDVKPVMNSQHMQLLQTMRKKQFNFDLADSVVENLPKGGALCRENLKIDMNSLNGKRYLAPLTTVGNLPFRRLCVDLGAEVTCGEMAMGTGLLQGLATEWSLTKRHPCEKIFGVQLAGGFPDSMARATQLVAEECEVDFIDLNLGCPLDAVNDKCGGCALANRSQRCVDVLKSMNLVAGDVPITTKMRYGMHQGTRTAHYLMKRLVEAGVTQAITLHPRSREQRYTNLAEWDYVPQCVKAINKRCPLWICGDVLSYEDYYNRLETSGVDGVMIARGALIKPWIFTEIEERRHWDISATERLDLIRKFTNYGLENWGSDHCGVENTRRFLLEWLSFQCRYIPVGILEELPQKINERPPLYVGRNETETLLSSSKSSDWVKITEMFLGKTPDGFLFIPKHNASSY